MIRFTALVSVVGACFVAVFATPGRAEPEPDRVKQLEQRVAALEQRLAAVEQELAQAGRVLSHTSPVLPAEAAAQVAPPIPRMEGATNVPLVEGATGLEPAVDPKHPRSRPMIVRQQQVRPSILPGNKVGTANVGVTAINAKFNQYGLYLQRLVDAVQNEWDGLVASGKAYPPAGSYVVVRFILDQKGNIRRIVEVDNHSSDIGGTMCVTAITNRAPYGEWTKDMKGTLNADGEQLEFRFYYQ
jgi:hypothetical protein